MEKNILSSGEDTVPSVSTGSSQSHPHIYVKIQYQRNSFIIDLYRQNTLYACIGSGENRGSKLTNRSAAFSTNQRSPSSWSLIAGWTVSIHDFSPDPILARDHNINTD